MCFLHGVRTTSKDPTVIPTSSPPWHGGGLTPTSSLVTAVKLGRGEKNEKKKFCKSRQSEHRREVMERGFCDSQLSTNVCRRGWWVVRRGGVVVGQQGWGCEESHEKLLGSRVKIGSYIPVDEPGPDECGYQDFLRRTLHSLACWLTPPPCLPPMPDPTNVFC